MLCNLWLGSAQTLQHVVDSKLVGGGMAPAQHVHTQHSASTDVQVLKLWLLHPPVRAVMGFGVIVCMMV